MYSYLPRCQHIELLEAWHTIIKKYILIWCFSDDGGESGLLTCLFNISLQNESTDIEVCRKGEILMVLWVRTMCLCIRCASPVWLELIKVLLSKNPSFLITSTRAVFALRVFLKNYADGQEEFHCAL